MSTAQVPGSKKANQDKLYAGCWAKHKDGSLVWVYEPDSKGSVVYSMFDMAHKPPLEYRDAMKRKAFDKQFNDSGWTWHDKHPEDFPWDDIMAVYPPGVRDPSAAAVLSAAEMIAQRVGLVGQAVSTDKEVPAVEGRVGQLVDRLQGAIDDFKT